MVTYVVAPVLLWVGLWVSIAVAVVLLASMVGARLRRRRREQQDRRRIAPLRPVLLALASGEAIEVDLAVDLNALPGPTRDVVDDAIVQMLGKIRGDSVAPLVEVLRQHARGERAVQELTSRSSVTRARAVWTLGVMRERDAVPHALALLQDPSSDVVLTAARSLGMMGDPIAAGPVLTAVAPEGSRSGLPVWIAVESVASLGTDTTAEVCAALAHPSLDVRTAAAMVIARVPLVAAAGALRQRMEIETDPPLVAILVLALGEVGGPRDVELLGPLLASGQDAQIRRAAVGAVAEVGGTRAVAWLQPLLYSRDIRVAELTATTLVSLGSAGHQAVSAVAASGALSANGRLCRYAVAQEALAHPRTVQRAS